MRVTSTTDKTKNHTGGVEPVIIEIVKHWRSQGSTVTCVCIGIQAAMQLYETRGLPTDNFQFIPHVICEIADVAVWFVPTVDDLEIVPVTITIHDVSALDMDGTGAPGGRVQ